MLLILGFVFLVLSQIAPFIPYMIHTFQVMHADPSLAKGPPPRPHVGDFEMFLPTAILIGIVLLWVGLFERRGPSAIGFNGNGIWRFLRGYLIGCAFLIVVVCGLWGMGVYQVEGPGAWTTPTLAVLTPILIYAGLFIIQGSSEEVLMRGWIMQTVASRHGILFAVILNSLAFGALHLGNIKPSPAMWAGVSNVALFGIFISLYACRDRSLWGVCGWHAAWNWLLGLGFGLEVSGLKMNAAPLIIDLKDTPNAPWWLSGGEWGPEASVFTTAVLLAGIIFLIWKGALKPGASFAAPQVEAS